MRDAPGHYRKRPVVIEAVQFDRHSAEAIIEWARDGGTPRWHVRAKRFAGGVHGGPITRLVIPTLEGDMTAVAGDWIIRGVQGEIYPIKDEIFRQTYEPADAPQPPADDAMLCPYCGAPIDYEAQAHDCPADRRPTSRVATISLTAEQRAELRAAIAGERPGFVETESPEARWITDVANACPACGGSGHRGDTPQPPADVPNDVELPAKSVADGRLTMRGPRMPSGGSPLIASERDANAVRQGVTGGERPAADVREALAKVLQRALPPHLTDYLGYRSIADAILSSGLSI